MIAECLKKVVSGQDLSEKEAYECMMEMVSGNASDVLMAAFLASLTTKGEVVEEITGFVNAMRDVCIKISPKLEVPLLDTCGTGGDRFKTFNVSTIAAIIAASCGVTIAKHGNRSITSKCGGADILEALGVKIECDVKKVEECIEKAGIGFMFAPNFHPAMRHVMPVRRELGIRTVFNILGPLSSPANANIQLLGVFDPKYVDTMAEVLKNLGTKRAMVVHGFDEDGRPAMDEISIIGKTQFAILDEGKIHKGEIYPEDLGIKRANPEFIRAPEGIDENIELVIQILEGKKETPKMEARLNLSLVNAGAVLFLAGKSKNLKDGIKIARNAVESGSALEKLEEFVKISNE